MAVAEARACAPVKPDAHARLQDKTRSFVQRRSQALVESGQAPAVPFDGVDSATDRVMVAVRSRYNRMTLKARTEQSPAF
ncbi:MAG: hypothetical protein KGL95_01415 [Patescibacteria group bacterium]|nr:hypothetical protein [Patescibacteria group bacterium]